MRKSLSRDRVDLDAPIARPDFAPRRGTYDIPASGSQDEPLVCFKVNSRWVAHLIGVLAALDQPDAWQGTSTAIEDARGEVRKIIANMESCEDVITDVRINDCILEAFVNGVWIPKGDITSCVVAIGGDTADDRYEDRPWDEPNEDDLPGAVNDLDCLWGGCLSLVDYLIAVASNVADLMDAAATAADAVGDLLVLFPALSRVGVSTALAAIEGGLVITTAILRQAFTPEAKEAIACELFCLIREAGNGNTLTVELLEEWFDVVNAHFNDDPQQIWSPGISWVGDIGRDIAGRHYALKRFELGLNNCDSDWMILCTDCNTIVYPFNRCWFGDNTAPTGEWSFVSFAGFSGYTPCTSSLVANKPEGCFNGNVSGTRVWSTMVRYDLPPGTNTITRISANFQTNKNVGSSDTSAIEAYDALDNKIIDERSNLNAETFDWTGSRSDIAYIRVYARCSRNDALGYARINGIRIEGTSDIITEGGC